jgi:hypothetical protein
MNFFPLFKLGTIISYTIFHDITIINYHKYKSTLYLKKYLKNYPLFCNYLSVMINHNLYMGLIQANLTQIIIFLMGRKVLLLLLNKVFK